MSSPMGRCMDNQSACRLYILIKATSWSVWTWLALMYSVRTKRCPKGVSQRPGGGSIVVVCSGRWGAPTFSSSVKFPASIMAKAVWGPAKRASCRGGEGGGKQQREGEKESGCDGARQAGQSNNQLQSVDSSSRVMDVESTPKEARPRRPNRNE